MADWDLDELTERWQARWWEAGIQHAVGPGERRSGRRLGSATEPAGFGSGEPDPRRNEGRLADAGRPPGAGSGEPDPRRNEGHLAEARRPSFFIHFAYPGISGYLHVGHMRGFTYTDVLARYKRQTGHDVLFPAGFHASGIPAVAFAKEVERGEKTEYLRANGYDGPIEDLTDPEKVVAYFARVYQHEYWKRFGFLIDERRDCTTIDPGYRRFIQWQFRRLHDLGYLVQKPHYAPVCPVAGPVAVDKSETDIRQGGGAEVQEFVALRFTIPAGELVDTDDNFDRIVLPCATLRPETLYGVTNLWVHPEHEYELVRVWRDGAVADDDPSEVWCVSRQGRTKLLWQCERAEALDLTVPGSALLGETATAPVTGAKVPVVAGSFVDPLIATGIVMSVPGHAPFDYAAYLDAGLDKTLGEPPQIVTIEGYDDLPARAANRKHGAASQSDRAALEAATEEVYADEFNKGVLTDACGPYAGKRIREVKDDIRADFVQADHGRIIRQFSEPVVSRAGELVDIKRIPDQDFIHYADEAWTEAAVVHAKTMRILPQRYADDIDNVLRWFGDRACVRRGSWLGTEFPFKEGWIVEPIADSTFYSWYYLVSPYVNDGRLKPDDLTDAFFDFVVNGRGTAQDPVWEQVREDVLHFGPVDVNLGGKEHQTVHFPVYVMNNVALLDDPAMRPRGIFVNWWVTQKAGAKISKSKGGAEPIPGAARRYGVDPMRLYYCHVGSPHVDIEWDPDIVLTYRQHVLRLTRVCDDLLAADGGPGAMDGWLRAAWDRHLATARRAYEEYDLRGAAGELVYAVPETLRWYQRRGGANADLLRSVVRDWAAALCPVLPHTAEEMHHRAGGEGLCSTTAFPTPGEVDETALAAEEYLRSALEDVKTVQKLAGGGDRLALFTTPAWKSDLTRRALRMAAETEGKFPMGDFMGAVMQDPEMRALGKAVQALAGRLPSQVNQFSDAQKTALLAGVDEAAVLDAARDFIAQEVGVSDVRVHRADDETAPEHPKRSVAAPLKPGIALE